MERPIIFSSEMVRAILDGKKTQTRRVIKPQPDYAVLKKGTELEAHKCPQLAPVHSGRKEWGLYGMPFHGRDIPYFAFNCPYGKLGGRLWCKENYWLLNEDLLPFDTDILYRLTDNRIYAILTTEVQNGRYKTIEWCPSQTHPDFSQRGLYGRFGWSNLLTDKIQRIWAEGIRGLVSASRTQQWQRISAHFNVSSESQNNQKRSPSDMYGFSWNATIPVISNTTFRWRSDKQFTRKSMLGNTKGKLDGQEDTWTRKRRRQASDGKVIEFRNESFTMGNQKRTLQPTSSGKNAWNVASWYISSCSPEVLKLKPSIFMPRWASRIDLEITGVRVERIQNITEEDAKAEGCEIGHELTDDSPFFARESFQKLWDSINAKRGYGWEKNNWVWIISFKKVD